MRFWIGIGVAVGVAVFLFSLFREPEPPPVALVTPTPVSTAPQRTGITGGHGTATKGTMLYGRLLVGIVKLQESPYPLSRDQALAIAAIIKGMHEQQLDSAFLRGEIERVLTDGQKTFLSKRYDELRARPEFIFHPVGKAALEDFYKYLLARAGTPPSRDVTRPEGYFHKDTPGQKPAPYAYLLVEFSREVEGDPSLRLTAEQVDRLLPLYKPMPQESFSDEGIVSDVLNADQKTYIDREMRKPGLGPPDIRAAEEALVRLAESKQ